jgi:hypothetical protein
MRIEAAMTRLDRPGGARYALRRLSGLLHPPVIIYEPAAGSVSSCGISRWPSATAQSWG